MAAIENLEAALTSANDKIALLVTAITRIVGLVDPQKEVRIQAAADNVNGLATLFDTLRGQIEVVSPPPVVTPPAGQAGE